ncbi:FAD binding domain-containing protein [Nocardioides sp. Soil796]|uniref:FAD binding domain-containing protein n=1 Tax=Nocardioides sp. Soil796 TaxID=1736412 RepID=UPI000710F9F3|nr:FAD binding domain-containing protein [Nocardioides sp. Soil796]KRF14689.1 hypothetical protein ASH02_10315 [Nocardioides sp. Soil796]
MRAQALGAGLVAQTQSSIPPFELHRPGSVAEAVALLAVHPEAVIAAGCTDLTAQLREGRVPRDLISVRRVPDLQQVRHNGGVLRIGAGLTHHEGSRHPVLQATLPSLAAAWADIATVRIRYSATIGGNLLARRFRYEMPVLLGALEAGLELAGATEPRRPVDWLWRGGDHDGADHDGAGAGAWRTRGLLTGVAIGTSDLLWFGYERSMRPTTTVALAIRAVDGSLRVTATIGSEYRRPVTVSTTADVAHPADLDPGSVGRAVASRLPDDIEDRAGSAEYRRHLVAVLVGRLVATARDSGAQAPEGVTA